MKLPVVDTPTPPMLDASPDVGMAAWLFAYPLALTCARYFARSVNVVKSEEACAAEGAAASSATVQTIGEAAARKARESRRIVAERREVQRGRRRGKAGDVPIRSRSRS